jgi:hypothetical protein
MRVWGEQRTTQVISFSKPPEIETGEALPQDTTTCGGRVIRQCAMAQSGRGFAQQAARVYSGAQCGPKGFAELKPASYEQTSPHNCHRAACAILDRRWLADMPIAVRLEGARTG